MTAPSSLRVIDIERRFDEAIRARWPERTDRWRRNPPLHRIGARSKDR
jgi:hypothetical protein